MRFLIVLLLALLAAAGLWVMYTHPADVQPVEAALATPDRAPALRDHRPAQLEPVPEPPADEAPEPRPKRSAPAEREAIEPAPTREPPAPMGEDFETKYANHSVQDLNRASRTLLSEHRATIQTLMEERYANAFYDAYPYEFDADGERLDVSAVIPLPAPGEHRIRQVFEDPQVAEWRVVELPPAEYPDVYAQYAEYQWVSEAAKRRASDG